MSSPPVRALLRDGALILRSGPEGGNAPAPPQDALLEICAQASLTGIRRALILTDAARPPELSSVQAFNRIARTRGLEGLTARRVRPESGLGQKLLACFEEDARLRARRRLLNRVVENLSPETAPTALAQVQALPAAEPHAPLYAIAPRIEATACTGCDACLRVCPHQVLTQINDGDGPARYTIDPASCDGCGLCSTVCSTDAIRFDTMATAPADLSLASWRCRACGVNAHAPRATPPGDALCPVCRETGHHKRLFQVLS